MISRLANLLRTRLEAQGCPVPVVRGPERAAAESIVSTRIVVQREHGTDEAIGPGISRSTNPKMLASRQCHALIRIMAASPQDGADIGAHEDYADFIADLVIVQLHRAVSEDKKRPIQWVSARMLDRDELEHTGMQTWPGVVLEIRCIVDRAVFDVTWAAAKASEFAFAEDSINSRTVVGTDVACPQPAPVTP